MRRIVSAAALLALVGWVLVGSSGGPARADAASISGPALAERIAAGDAPLVLDVRTPAEFASGHVPGAVNIPHTELPARLDELGSDRDREVVVYCESGRRAGWAEQALREAGFTRVHHLEGDMRAWRSDGDLPCQGC